MPRPGRWHRLLFPGIPPRRLGDGLRAGRYFRLGRAQRECHRGSLRTRSQRGMNLAEEILGLHLVIIAFNVAGLIVIPLGSRLGWRIVRIAWLRLLRLAMLAI